MFADDSCIYSGRNLFVLCSENRYQFYHLTGETPETCLQLVNFIDMQLARNSRLTVVNRVFLFFTVFLLFQVESLKDDET